MTKTIAKQDRIVDQERDRFLTPSEVFLRKLFQKVLSDGNPKALNELKINNYLQYVSFKERRLKETDTTEIPSLPKFIWLEIFKINLFKKNSPNNLLALFTTCKALHQIEKNYGLLDWHKIKDDPNTPLRHKRIMLGFQSMYPELESPGLFLKLFLKLHKSDPSVKTKAPSLLPEFCWNKIFINHDEQKKFLKAVFSDTTSNFFNEVVSEVLKRKEQTAIELKTIGLINLHIRSFPQFIFSFLPNLSELKIVDSRCLITIDSKMVKTLSQLKKLTLVDIPYVQLEFEEHERPQDLQIYLDSARVYRIGKAILGQNLPWLHFIGDNGRPIDRFDYDYWGFFYNKINARESELSIQYLLREREYIKEAKAPLAQLYQAYAKQGLTSKDLTPFIEQLNNNDRRDFYRLIYCFAQTYQYQTPFKDFNLNDFIFLRMHNEQEQVSWGKECLPLLPQPIIDMAIRALVLGKIKEKETREHTAPYYWGRNNKCLTQFLDEIHEVKRIPT